MNWNVVPGRKPRQSGRKGSNSKKAGDEHENWTEEDVKEFLSTYKTRKCERDDFHDHRLCDKFHADKDQRRNPYRKYIDIEDDTTDANRLDLLYHPSIFRTVLCTNGKMCIFGAACSHAHSNKALRDRIEAALLYNTHSFERVRPALRMSEQIQSAIDVVRDVPKYSDLAHRHWESLRIIPRSEFLSLEHFQWFIVCKCKSLFDSMQESAFEECLGAISLTPKNRINIGGTPNKEPGILIKGLNPEIVACRIRSLLVEPSPYFVTETREYSERVIVRLKNNPLAITSSPNIQIEFLDYCTVRYTSVEIKGKEPGTARQHLNQAIEKIDFWVQKEGYDNTITCSCCFEDKNHDQGIVCINGHFFCSDGPTHQQCFSSMAMSQLEQLRTRTDCCLVCAECKNPYDTKQAATHLPIEVFQKYQDAVVDAKVAHHVDEMNQAFDERLEAAVKEVLKKYDSADAGIRLEARRLAKQARNEILNLRCPHCETAYAEFTGCMALACGTCERSFCGYCHAATATSQGAHEHVRQCLLNDTATGSYYATPEQIKEAQRKYRTRKIKKFLREHKKNVQNAVVIELKKDLEYLDIKQEALFELGNLMD